MLLNNIKEFSALRCLQEVLIVSLDLSHGEERYSFELPITTAHAQ
jgi:hypothetical protein